MAGPCTTVEGFSGALALISGGHRSAVLAHPEWASMACEPDPALQLAWMVRQGLLSYDDLDDLQTLHEEGSEQDRIVEQAFAALGD